MTSGAGKLPDKSPPVINPILAQGTVPEARLDAFKLVRPAPDPVMVVAVIAPMVALGAFIVPLTVSTPPTVRFPMFDRFTFRLGAFIVPRRLVFPRTVRLVVVVLLATMSGAAIAGWAKQPANSRPNIQFFTVLRLLAPSYLLCTRHCDLFENES